MNEGWSADQRGRELAAAGEGPAAAAWRAGAEGERRVAAQLATLRDVWTVLHDRLLRPGLSEANLGHVVVGPGGLLLVDAKNWSGNVTAFDGGLYQHVGPPAARASHSRHAEIAKVHGMAAYMAAETRMPGPCPSRSPLRSTAAECGSAFCPAKRPFLDPTDFGLHRSTEAEHGERAHDHCMGEADRIDAGTTWVIYEGPPYVDPTEGQMGWFVDICLGLSDAELTQLCGYWEWRADLATRDIDRWWCWTVVWFGRRLLAGRRENGGIHPFQPV